jgi:hypothetical protein
MHEAPIEVDGTLHRFNHLPQGDVLGPRGQAYAAA